MIREEAIKELKILKEEYWDDDGYGNETEQYDDTMTALDMAIKALEHEPILDKIRAEIMQLDYDTDYVDYDYDDMVQTETIHTICREEVIQIIDKYKTGEEEE